MLAKKMNKLEQPAWLKRMDNGAIGEARSKAFLMDRFWILERSVDIEGADLIIQRKITGSTLLDKAPPRLGVIQVKFFSSKKTTQYIHKEYILGENNKPRDEFFILCHTGFESDAKTFFLSAKDVAQNFKIADAEHSNEGKYILPGSVVLSDKFLVSSSKIILDRIENLLKLADFKNNRQFLSWALPNISKEDSIISPLYLEPIDNWWGDIPAEFYNMKKKARSSLYNLEEVFNLYKQIVETSDPERALEIAEEIEACHKGGGRIYVSLPSDLYNEDFYSTVKEHKRKCTVLKQHGRLDDFIIFRSSLMKTVYDEALPMVENLKSGLIYILEIKFTISPLKIINLSSEFSEKDSFNIKQIIATDEDSDEYSGLSFSNDGIGLIYFAPSSCGNFSKKKYDSYEKFINKFHINCIYRFMEKLFEEIEKINS